MIETLMSLDYTPFAISFELALITTIILFVFSAPISWYLANGKSKFIPFLESLVTLPLVLPPSVIGFYVLYALSYDSFIGNFFKDYFNIELVFNFTGLVVASCIYSMPFMIQPLQSGFANINKNMIEASYISGKSKFKTFLKIILPNVKSSILTALIITFSHTVGEFGVVLMIGGSIPGETKVASVAIYEFVEIMDYTSAHIYSGIMVLISFSVLLSVYYFNRKIEKNKNDKNRY